jgi:hypothetical protein
LGAAAVNIRPARVVLLPAGNRKGGGLIMIRPESVPMSVPNPSQQNPLKIKGRPNVLRSRCFFSRARAQAREFTYIYLGQSGTLGQEAAR